MPTGSISLVLDTLRTLLAGTAAFRTWVGAENQAEALARIHRHRLPRPAAGAAYHSRTELEAYRPYALVWWETPFRRRRLGQAEWIGQGTLKLELMQDVAEADWEVDGPDGTADLAWDDTVGGIVDALEAAAVATGFTEITVVKCGCVDPAEAESVGHFQAAEIQISFDGDV